MQYETRVVCFLDILGFRDRINKTIGESNKDNQSEIDVILEGLRIITNLSASDSKLIDIYETKVVTQFSDSIVISFLANESDAFSGLLITLSHLQQVIPSVGFILRGGITIGKAIHGENHLFGPAVIRAYDLERKYAVHPRIIVDKEVIDNAVDVFKGDNAGEMLGFKDAIDNFLTKDDDGWYYVDYFGKGNGYIHKSILPVVRQGLESSDPKIKSKYEWIRNKLEARGIKI